ncbi:hypothetical protein L7F22_006891 [Adiantum nelumboides]|nr:hypothetical protein [Adiantum nelumboides]
MERVTDCESDTGNGTDESDHSKWQMGTGKASRRKERSIGHRSRTLDGRYSKDRGPDLKIACPIFKGNKHDDPNVHIQAFERYAELKHILEEEWGEYFPHTLKEAAKKWYYHYPTSTLQAYKKLKKAFILEYADDRGDEDILCELDRIKQGKLSVRKYVQKIKELTRRLNEPPSEKRMRAWFLSGFNSRKLREQQVPAPTKKFTELVHRALKLEQQAKKEKSRHSSKYESSTSDSTETEKSSSSSSKSSKDEKKKKKRGSWSKKIDDMSRRIFEIFGLRRASASTKQPQTASTNTSRYNGRGRGGNGNADFKKNFNYYKYGMYGDEWKDQRELATKITENLEKKKPEILECSEARTVQSILVAVAEALLLETQTVGIGSIPVDSFEAITYSENEQDEIEVQMCQRIQQLSIELEDIKKSLLSSIPVDSSEDNSNSENEEDEIEVQMCQRIQQLTIELEDIKKSLPAMAKFIKQKKQAEAMTVEVPQIKDD